MSTIIKSMGIFQFPNIRNAVSFLSRESNRKPDNNSRKGKKSSETSIFFRTPTPMCSPSRFFPASRFSTPSPPPCRKGITAAERIAARGEISIRRYRLANNANRPTGVRGRKGRRLIASHCTRRIVFAVVYRELPPWALLSLIKWLIWARKIWSALRFDISSPSSLPFPLP